VVAACPFPERRGTPVRIQRIAEGMARRGHDVHVVTYPFGSGPLGEGLTVHRVPRAGTRHRTAPGPSPSKLLVLDPLVTWRLRRILRTRPIDVIHAHHYEGLLVAVAARIGTGIPVVYDAHTLLATELPTYAPHLPAGLKRAMGTRLDRWLPGWADHVISVSDTIREVLRSDTRLEDGQVTSVSNGVEVELFDRAGAAPARERPPTVVFTGNLASYQGIDLLLEAFRQVRTARPDVRLRIVTESSFAEHEASARALGIREAIEVVETGFDDVPRLLATADVAVNPRPDCSGIPLKLLNYMAASKPAVSFEGSAPGVVHGRTGWLVAKGDVAAFARGILALVDDPALAQEIGGRARRHVETHHSWAAAAEATEEVYRLTLERTRRPRWSGASAGWKPARERRASSVGTGKP
jgi:glycosyltransferase involved in cell wall biosynthesis